jgi:hypothetical protein
MPTLRRPTSGKLMCFAIKSIIVNAYEMGYLKSWIRSSYKICYLNSWIRSSKLREMEMPTLRRPTTGKLVCFANKTLLLRLITWVTFK